MTRRRRRRQVPRALADRYTPDRGRPGIRGAPTTTSTSTTRCRPTASRVGRVLDVIALEDLRGSSSTSSACASSRCASAALAARWVHRGPRVVVTSPARSTRGERTQRRDHVCRHARSRGARVWGEVGWEELDRRCARRRAAQRRAHVVPVQRPPAHQGDLPHRVRVRLPVRRRARPARSSVGPRARKPHAPRLRAARPDGDLPRRRPRRAATSGAVLAEAAGAARSSSHRPRCTRAGACDDLRLQPQMMSVFATSSGPTPSTTTPSSSPPTTSRSRSRRRGWRRSGPTGSTVVGAHERLVAHELAHQWFGNSLTVTVVGRHLAQRGLRLLRRVALGRARRRHPTADALSAQTHWTRLAGLAAGPRARRPRARA